MKLLRMSEPELSVVQKLLRPQFTFLSASPGYSVTQARLVLSKDEETIVTGIT